MEEKLYVAYLGGPMPQGRFGEEHEVVFVVAEDKQAAKTKAKTKWSGEEVKGVHVDSILEVSTVDGHQISISKL